MRRHPLLLAVLLTLPFALAPGTAAQSPSGGVSAPVTLRFGISDPVGRPSQEAVETFIAEVESRSGGSIEVEPVWDAGGGGGFEEATAGLVIDGTVDLALVASRAWDLVGVTSLQALQAPFLIDNDALAAAVTQSETAGRAMEGLADVGVTGLAMWPEDLRHPFSWLPDQPLLAPEDFSGKTILVQPSGVSRALVQALGGSVHVGDRDADVPAGRLHGAESGLLQGQSLPGTPTATGNVVFYPKFQVLVASTSALAELSPAQQDVIREAAAATQQEAIESHPAEAEASAAWCEAGGAIAFASPDQVAAMETAAQPVFDRIAEDPLASSLISEIRTLEETVIPSPGAEACESEDAAPQAAASAQPEPGPTAASDDPVLELTATWDDSVIPGLSYPAGMDLSEEGELYVVNAGTNEVLVLDREGSVVRRWGETGSGQGQLLFTREGIEPIGGVAVGPDGSVYVTEPGINRVQQFDEDGTFIRRWGEPGSEDGQFLYPWDVDVAPDGTVYVVDAERDDIQRFTADGVHLETFGRKGSGEGELMETASVFIDEDGVLYNADWRNDRVQAWGPSGEFLWSLVGSDGRRLTLPNDVATDAAGTIFVTTQRRVDVFDADRAAVGTWTTPAATPNDEILSIVVGDGGDVFVSLPYNHLIHRLHDVRE
jgi:TRAP-type C4-dicarboxylate transport system substrate-binding protein/DNA-binding beta-propeller fold protein YncE